MAREQIGRLLSAHKTHISSSRGIPITGSVDSDDLEKVSNRAALITLLDIILEFHRVKHSSYLNPLKGRDALTHLILTKYKWPVETINRMTISDSVLAIQDELFADVDNLPELAKTLLKNVNAQYYCQNFDDFPDTDWEPLLHEEYLSLQG